VAATLGLTYPERARWPCGWRKARAWRKWPGPPGHTRGAIYWHLKQIYQKLHISRQAELVRLVLSIAEFG